MISVVQQMLDRYHPVSRKDYENALKEIVQEIALLGLHRANFFEKAAFYGGTALRILYGLPRFSEDLDFTLFVGHSNFSLEPYFSSMERELKAYGFDVEINAIKKNAKTPIESAFIKTNTKIHLLRIAPQAQFVSQIQNNDKMQIKFEVDTDPAKSFLTEPKFLFQPVGFPVITLKEPDLFAGKIHALLFRPWLNRIKGRDFYDYAWYLGRGSPIRLSYFCEMLKRHSTQKVGNISDLKNLILQRLESVDFQKAKADVLPFIKNPADLNSWGYEYFATLTHLLQAAD